MKTTAPVQDGSFPLIARAIEQLHRGHEKFVPRNDIARFLLRDSESNSFVKGAYQQTKRKISIEKYSGNLVDWFSQRWTVGEPKWLELFKKFERSETKINGHWAYKPSKPSSVIVFPDEVEEDELSGLPEGAAFERMVNGYERNPLARQLCVKKYGSNCFICGFSFGEKYGNVVDGLIHVHHLRQLSEIGKEYKVDPVLDLRPVCPNCHAVVHHRRNRPYSIDEVRAFLRR